MKITTELCKELIVQKCREMLEMIQNEFVPQLTDEEVKKTLNTENWDFRYREENNYSVVEGVLIERMFDCEPFDDQLRAYVYTDESDSIIKEITVQGE